MFKKSKKAQGVEGFRLLVTAGDAIEASIIESELNAAGIDTIRNYREPGAYLALVLGNTIMGVDILVSEDKYEEAREILESASEISDEDILADSSFNDESIRARNEDNLKKLGTSAWIMLTILLIIIAAAIVIYIVQPFG